MIGKVVTVTIDRPLGSYHPEYTELYYPINYGYVKGIMSADGEEMDAYVLGVSQPIAEFTGRVIAVIHRLNDVEDKLVVAPEGMSFRREDVLKMTEFQERYFQTRIEM